MKKSILDTLELLHRKSPKEVEMIYRRYGVVAPASIQTTLDLYALHGDEFLIQLYDLVYDSEQFLGKLFQGAKNVVSNIKEKRAAKSSGSLPIDDLDHESAHAEETQDKASGWDNFKSGIGSILGGVLGGGGATPPISGKKEEEDTEEKGKQILSLNPPVFYGLVALIIILIVLAIANSFNKNK